jgi:hypothetical protein
MTVGPMPRARTKGGTVVAAIERLYLCEGNEGEGDYLDGRGATIRMALGGRGGKMIVTERQ